VRKEKRKLIVAKEKIMNYYLIAKFIHIVGALGMFVTLGVEWLSLWNMRHAVSNTQIGEWLRITRGVQRLGGPSMAALLVSGIYMMAVARMHMSWLVVSFIALILLGVLGAVLAGRHMKSIRQSMDRESESISPLLSQALHQPILWIVMQTRVAVTLGVVFLMTAKPDLSGSLLTMGIAVILGVASALLTLRREAVNKPELNPNRT
jgi:uncharacterized membrane protein